MSSNNASKAYGRAGAQGGQPSYQNIPQPGNPTYTEAWALIEAARRMGVAIQSGPMEEVENRRTVRDAIRLNWRLWTIFQAELTVGTAPIDEEIRLNMLTLCKFVDSHTIDTMAKPTPEKIAVLIDLNRNIAQGLLASLENAQEGKDAIAQEAEGVQSNKLDSVNQEA